MAVPSRCTVEKPLQCGWPKYTRLHESVFLISGEMGKKLLAANSTDSLFSEFLLHRMFNSKVPLKSVESKTSESIYHEQCFNYLI